MFLNIYFNFFICSKKRTVGVVEPRVVVKIPLAKVRGSFTESSNSIIRQQEQENLHPFIGKSVKRLPAFVGNKY